MSNPGQINQPLSIWHSCAASETLSWMSNENTFQMESRQLYSTAVFGVKPGCAARRIDEQQLSAYFLLQARGHRKFNFRMRKPIPRK
jgi:hypothetical protein